MRKLNFVHTSCIFDAEVNYTRKGVRICRDESFSHTGKRKLSSAPSASRTTAATGREEKAFNALSLAEPQSTQRKTRYIVGRK